MAKSKNRTTALPERAKRDINLRKYRSRSERESYYNRVVLLASGVLFGLIVLILAVALLIEGVIVPNQPVASVGGQNISTRDFQRRVVFERWRAGGLLSNVVNSFGSQYAQQLLSNSQNPYGQLYAQLQSPTLMGQRVLDDMTNELVIKQYADANGIKVDENEINKRMNDYFGYDPNPQTATPTATSTITPTPLVSATPTSTPTITPAPSQTATPTFTPIPTGIPTATPGPTERAETFNKNRQDYFERAAKETGYTESEIRQIFVMDALRKKVEETVLGKPKDQQEQVKARHILVDSEEQANDLMKALQNGESFADLARADSKDTGSGAQGGELGWAGKGQYVPEFEAAVWSDKSKVGDVLGPIKTQYGYHIIQLEGRELRTLAESEKQQAQDKAFQDWVTAQAKEKNVQKDDIWAARTPANPTLEEMNLPQFGGGSSIPGFPG